MEGVTRGFTPALSGLSRRNGRLVLDRPGGDPVEVTLRYLRPLSSRTEVVLLDTKGREVATLESLDAFP